MNRCIRDISDGGFSLITKHSGSSTVITTIISLARSGSICTYRFHCIILGSYCFDQTIVRMRDKVLFCRLDVHILYEEVILFL